MRTVPVDRDQQIARGIIELDQPTLVTQIQLGALPSGEPAVPRLRILIDGHVAAECYWKTITSAPDGTVQARYVYPGEKGSLPLLLPKGRIEFRVQARDQGVSQVPIEDRADPVWRFEWSADAGKTWQPIDGALPIKLRKLPFWGQSSWAPKL